MDVKKNMYFYRIIVNPSFRTTQTDPIEGLKQAFEIIFPATDKNSDSPSREFYIQILSKDNEHIFGTYSKKNDPNPFERKRNLKSQKIEEIVARGENEILEYYTFFYIDYKTQYMGVITNKQTLQIRDDIKSFASVQCINLEILPFFDESQEEVLKKFSSVKSASFACTTDCLCNSFHSIGQDLQLVSDVPIKRINITIDFDTKTESSLKPEKLFKGFLFPGFKSVKINGKGNQTDTDAPNSGYDQDFSQCYDIITHRYSRSVTITLPDSLSEKKQFKKVEQIMCLEINKARLE